MDSISLSNINRVRSDSIKLLLNFGKVKSFETLIKMFLKSLKIQWNSSLMHLPAKNMYKHDIYFCEYIFMQEAFVWKNYRKINGIQHFWNKY